MWHSASMSLETHERRSAARLSGLAPVVAPGARLLVLGSFPSAASLQAQQYYAHPRNHFWPILSALWGLSGDAALQHRPYAERLPLAHAHGLAIWDVYAGCEREGSLDSAIREAELNDLPGLVRQVPTLRAIAHNGGESARHKRLTQALGLPVTQLPSTSPANASWSFERKLAAWRAVFEQAGVMRPIEGRFA
ncbi:MAG: DNA-deoxyinosine glycosylase [Aquabacterium sp.]|nr:DNA-deoxyinosine glycosylase [Aquabacterium sp.]